MVIKLTDSTLKTSLSKDGLKPLYVLVGNDAFLLSSCLQLIEKEVGGEVVTLSFKDAEAEIVEEHLSSFSFQPKVLVLDGFAASAWVEEKKKLYSEFLPQAPETLTVVVKLLSDDARFQVPKAAEAFAALVEDGVLVRCERKTGGDLQRYIVALAKRCGCTIDTDAVTELIRLAGEDLQQLYSHLQVLAARVNYENITKQDVARMVPKSTEENVFDFVRAMERGRAKEAVALLYAMLEQEQEPARVLAAISSSFVNLNRAKAAIRNKKRISEVEEDFGYRKNDRALSVAFDKANRYSERQIRAILKCLLDVDLQLKTFGGDKQILLEQAMVRLTMLVSGREVV